MKLKTAEFYRLTGLGSKNTALGKSGDILLTGASTDPQTGLVAMLSSAMTFNDKKNPQSLAIKYWRQLPYGESRDQNLIAVKLAPSSNSNTVEIDKIYVQSTCVYDRGRDDAAEPETRKRINRVLEGCNRLNTHLRAKGDVADTAKILDECHFDKVVGEDLVIRGLSKKGGFNFSLSPYFMKMAAPGQGMTLANLDINMLKTALGFHINGLEPDKNFSESRPVLATDPQSGVTYEAGVKLKQTKDRVGITLYVEPTSVPDPEVEAKAIPDLVSLDFKRRKKRKKKGDNPQDQEEEFVLTDAKFLGQQVKPEDTNAVLRLLGVAQASNRLLADWKYPSFMDSTAEYDLLDMVDPLHPPPSLEDAGGEMLYVSLHGSGVEKVIENFGDQIGMGDLLLHRGTKKDGSISSVGVAVDFPFATGGANSNYDGAIPDYLPFWKDIKAFLITHDHFDHCDGLAFYAKAGLMKEKKVYATPEVKYFLDKKMDFLKVPRRLRPKITMLEDEKPFAIFDDEGNTRMWVQPCPNGASHSARCTPYILTGCYNDRHYNASAAVYGDANKLTQKGVEFFARGLQPLRDLAGITAEKVKDLLTVYHDITAINLEGKAPEREEFEETLEEIFGFFSDKGILMTPISTNDVEYTGALNVAHRTKRDITAVGRNAELRLACKNLFGVTDDLNLRDVKLDPFEELRNPNSLIPKEILDMYFASLEMAEEDDDPDLDEEELNALREKRIAKARDRALKAYKEKLEPSEREHEKSVELFMLKSLFKHDAVVFENDVNDYLMYQAILDRSLEASIRATRNSNLGKSFRIDPKHLMIMITGTQGNAEERFSTLQKLVDFFSLLDVDESVRSTGYKINVDDFVAVISQPGIVGNEDYQTRMIRDLVRKRDITVVCAFRNGYTIFNPKEKGDKIVAELRRKGRRAEISPSGDINVYGRSAHYHGHGFKENVRQLVRSIKARFHEAHHIPSDDNFTGHFLPLLKDEGVRHSGIKVGDFQVMRLNAHAEKPEDQYCKVAQLNPSYVLVKLSRKYGHYFGGWLQLIRTTMLRRDGQHRADGMMVSTTGDGIYTRKTAQLDWQKVSNPHFFEPTSRRRKIGPSIVDRGQADDGHRSRPVWSAPLPETEVA